MVNRVLANRYVYVNAHFEKAEETVVVKGLLRCYFRENNALGDCAYLSRDTKTDPT